MAFELFQKIRDRCRSDSLERILSLDHQRTCELPKELKGDKQHHQKGENTQQLSGDGNPHQHSEENAALAEDRKISTSKNFTPNTPDWTEFEGCFASDMLTVDGKTKLKRRFFMELLDISLHHVSLSESRRHKVLDFHHPHQLHEIMEHCIELDENGRDLEQILSDCKETLKYCIRTGHPRFLNQLSTGMDMIGIAGEWLTAVANTNMFTYEVAPVFTLMEEVLLRKMLSFVGWKDGDGTFAPGGAISNFYGMLAARHSKFPDIKRKGFAGQSQMVVFTSSHSHFSMKKSASLLGLGTDAVVYVDCDSSGRMLPEDLTRRIDLSLTRGEVPLMVNVTCGTTVFGAFDPVNDISAICKKYNIWLHVDGAWGGSVLLSERHRHLLAGVSSANSMTWNPHKMMGVPLQCSAILLRQKGILHDVNALGASYLYQNDKHYDVTYDTGDKTIQCGRHNDVFKLWLMWRAKGDKGFESQIDKNFRLAKYLMNKIHERPNFKLVNNEFQAPNVCFWFIPDSVACVEDPDKYKTELGKVAPRLKAAMMEKGSMMLAYQPLLDLPNFFRVAISNPALQESDLDFVVSELELLAKGI
ncbi:glutamate decarboxylase 1-like [Ylistrum balloti]|uniref:glutamate decarboxylase 1-like n=1 Tax=Ylistrum balloti TaxID=509963 RepID=UPI002905F200|nr:glutamate decarboxylase 1-like [Ylistrum balloti]